MNIYALSAGHICQSFIWVYNFAVKKMKRERTDGFITKDNYDKQPDEIQPFPVSRAVCVFDVTLLEGLC